jgi:hypothetical protein
VKSLVRNNLWLAVILGLAVALRVAAELAYRPALLWDDSWAYVNIALRDVPVSLSASRPSGYPLLVRIFSLNGESLFTLTVLQHLAGLATGVLVYAVLVRFGRDKRLAAVAAAIVLLDAYAISLEQSVMAEAFFATAMLASAYLLTRATDWRLYAASGVLLAAAATMRTAALFAVPIWLWYVLRPPRNRLAAGAAIGALAAPLLVYCAAHAALGRGFTVTESDGWFLYGRVGRFADCASATVPAPTRRLCERRPIHHRSDPTWYVWDAASPANRMFGHVGGADSAASARSNRLLRNHALAIIRHQPVDYTKEIASDMGELFSPGGGAVEPVLVMPARPWPVDAYGRDVHERFLPGYQARVRAPAGALRSYQSVFHTVRPLAGVLALAVVALAVAATTARGRRAIPAFREALLFGGMGVSVVLGAAMTVDSLVRFLVPAVPLLVTGVLLAVPPACRSPRS